MKRILTEAQYVEMANESFGKLMSTVPFVSDTEIISTGLQRGFGKFYAIVHFTDSDETQKFCIEVKTNGEKRFVNGFMQEASQHSNDSCYVFVAPYISAASADSMVEQNFSYMDLSGNCYILTRRMILHYKGNENKYVSLKEKKNFLTKSAGSASTVIRTMLDSPNSTWQVASLAAKTGKAIGTVSNVKAFLKDRDMIEEVESGFILKNIKELLYTWSKDYHKKDSLSFEYYSLDKVAELERMISHWNAGHDDSALLSGFAAAARYCPTVRYNKLEIYLERQALNDFVLDIGISPVESGGNVIITIPHDDTPCMFSRKIDGDAVTSPVQTVIDLLGNPARGEEAAEAIIIKEYDRRAR